jgi:foldase protein PrsA
VTQESVGLAPRRTFFKNPLVMLGAVAALLALVGGTYFAMNQLQPQATVAATVNGEPIYTTDVNKYVAQIAQRHGVDLSRPESAKQRAEILDTVLQQLIDRSIILQEARQRGLLATEAEVETRLAALRKNFKTESEFKNALEVRGVSLAELQQQARLQLSLERLMAALPAQKPTDEEIRAEFLKNPKAFDTPEHVRASHILVKTEAEGRIILARLKAGEPFEKIAEEVSLDPGSKQRGGDLGAFARGQMVPEFEKAAFTQPIGQVGDPVRSQFGFHIILVKERSAAKTGTFETAKPNLEKKLTAERQQKAMETWMIEARKKAAIVKKI